MCMYVRVSKNIYVGVYISNAAPDVCVPVCLLENNLRVPVCTCLRRSIYVPIYKYVYVCVYINMFLRVVVR